MRQFHVRQKKGPEAKIQEEIIKYLEARNWLVMVTHGNLYQRGFPDLYATHKEYGSRWIEVKNPKKYHFTKAQLEFFPLLTNNGTKIWILVAATDSEYRKLFKDHNWYKYL